MAQDPLAPTAQDVKNAQDLQKSLSETSNTYASILSVVEKIGNAELAEQLTTAKKTAEINKIMKGYDAELKSINAISKLSKEQLKSIKDSLAVVAKQAVETQRLNDFAKTALENERKKLGLLKEQLTTEQAISREAQRQAKEEAKEAGKAAAQSTVGVINKVGAIGSQVDNIQGSSIKSGVQGAAGLAGAGIGTLLGGPGFGTAVGAAVGDAVGGIGTSLASLFGSMKVQAAGLAKAMAGGGMYAKGAKDLDKLTAGFEGLRARGVQAGLTWQKTTKNMNEMASAGITLSDSFEGNVKKSTHLNAIANNLGISLGQLSSGLVTLRRTSRGANDEVEVANGLATTANTLVKADIMSQSEFLDMFSQVSDSFSELNTPVDKTRNLLRDLTLNVKNLGVNAKVAKEITMQLTGSFKATGDEWKAFMGAKTGAGGGFLGGLFSAQQRGPGGDVLNREVDPRKYMEGVMKTIKGQTAGIADPRAKMYMAETLGKNFGLDAKGTQALLKGVLGNTSEQADSIDEMLEASEKVELSSMDIWDKAAAWLDQHVFQELVAIKGILNAFLHPLDTLANPKTAMKAVGGLADNPLIKYNPALALPAAGVRAGIWGMEKMGFGGDEKKANAGNAAGGTMPDTGMILAHRGEEVLDASTASQYRKMGGLGGMQGSGGISVSIGNISLGGGGDARSQSQAIGKAVQEESYKQIMKYHETMYGQG